MGKAPILILGLVFSAVYADVRVDDVFDDDSWGLSGCSGTGTAGGWTRVNLQDVKQFQSVTSLVYTAAREYLAANADLIQSMNLYCYDDNDDGSGLEYSLNYACKQVVAGTNYKIGFTVDCDEFRSTREWYIPLEARIFEPLPGQGSISVNVTKRDVQCSTFNSIKANCFFGSYGLDCDATNPKTSDTNSMATFRCEVYNKTADFVTPVFTFFCPVTVNSTTGALDTSCDLSMVPTDLRNNISAILDKWRVAPRYGNFFDDSDLDDIWDDDDDDGDYNYEYNDSGDRRRFARLF